jgi:hypothetical protein
LPEIKLTSKLVRKKGIVSMTAASWTSVLLKACRILGPLQALAPVGGSCGLALQGVEIDKIPRDIDMYYDRPAGYQLHTLLSPYVKTAPHESETDRYRSILSHYDMDGLTIELVGAFRVREQGSEYNVEIKSWISRYCPIVKIEGVGIYVMPLVHEFVFNLLRDRSDRLEAIVRVMRHELPVHLPILQDFLTTHKFSENHVQSMEEWLDIKLVR